VAAAAAQAGAQPGSAAPASSEGYESAEGGIGLAPEPGPEPEPSGAQESPDAPQLPKAPTKQDDEPLLLGRPQEEEPQIQSEPARDEEREYVPLAKFLQQRDARKQAQAEFERLQQEAEQLRHWRQEYEPVLEEARRIWPEMQQQASQVPHLMQELEHQKALLSFYKQHLAKAQEEYGLDVDEASFEKDLRMQRALARIENLDTTINAALSQTLSEREAMYAQHQHEAAQRAAAERARQEREERFNTEFTALTGKAPGLKNFRNALRAEFESNPGARLQDIAADLVQTLTARQAVADDSAARMVRTQGASSAARPQVGPDNPADKYRGMGVREIIAARRAELKRSGLL